MRARHDTPEPGGMPLVLWKSPPVAEKHLEVAFN
jgi:hypothetical protein